MMKINLFSILFFFTLTAGAQKAPSLLKVKELISAKKPAEAATFIKTEKARLLRTEKDYKDVAAWFSLFLYESSMELYDKAWEQTATDVSGAQEQFEELVSKEPYNKTALTTYLSFLITQKKWSDVEKLLNSSIERLPFFPIFSVYKIFFAIEKEEPLVLVTCDKKTMSSIEVELCHYANFIAKITPREGKKKTADSELRGITKKSDIPDIYYWLWVETKNINHLKRYVSLCKNMNEKHKKNYRIVPGLCAKVQESESQMELKSNEEPNTP